MVRSAAAWFAESATPSPQPEAPRYIDPATVGPGLIGLVIFVLLALATFLLWRSMNKQLRKVDFDEGRDEPQPEPGTQSRERDQAND